MRAVLIMVMRSRPYERQRSRPSGSHKAKRNWLTK
jgi:hypothetical protein